jgi:tRNA dimethylallyltransferase
MTAAPRMPVIIGPTAGGKTAIAVSVAQLLAEQGLPGEVISADSVQIYRTMDIGSAKPTADEQAGVPHHLIDCIDPAEPFTVHDWLTLAEAAIADIRTRGGVPIITGGTHLYIKALLDGLFAGPDPDPELRARLSALPLDILRARLESVDPEAATRIHPNDLRRTVRALEVFDLTGTPISELQQQWDRKNPRRDDLRVFALRWPSADINARINRRARAMIEQGLVEEVRAIEPELGVQARQALGYKQILASFAGRITLEQAIEAIKIETRRFAKNQRTWLKRLARDERFEWIDMDGSDIEAAVQGIVATCMARR